MINSKRRHGKWARGAPKTEEQLEAVRRKGRTSIPTREELNILNLPLRDAAEAKKNPPKVRRKRK